MIYWRWFLAGIALGILLVVLLATIAAKLDDREAKQELTKRVRADESD